MRKILFLAIWSVSFGLNAQTGVEQSITGQCPPQEIDLKGYKLSSKDTSVVIANVPAYYWRYGCGPTAVGMVVGYYNANGFPGLMNGNSMSQTDTVNQAMASTEHYNDYSLPLDYSPNMLVDLSEDPVGDEHDNNCIADFMFTSRSARGNYYGWSWGSDIPYSFTAYIDHVSGYVSNARRVYLSSFPFDSLKNEIDQNHPMVYLVDTDGNGNTDHFITTVGYSTSGGINYYGCYNTWDTDIHWYEYREIGSGVPWGISSCTLFRIDSLSTQIGDVEVSGNLSVFPNPCTDKVFIESEISIAVAEIYNSIGQELTEIHLNGATVLDVSGLPDGYYLLRLCDTNNNHWVKKFLKQ